MPRLGEDPNVAVAYPHGGSQGNLRRSWLRQLVITGMGTLFLMMVMKNVLFKDYKGETKEYLMTHGMEDKVDKVIPKSAAEKRDEEKLQKMADKEKIAFLMDSVKNLTENVQELQLQVGNLRGGAVEVEPKLEENSADDSTDEAGQGATRRGLGLFRSSRRKGVRDAR